MVSVPYPGEEWVKLINQVNAHVLHVGCFPARHLHLYSDDFHDRVNHLSSCSVAQVVNGLYFEDRATPFQNAFPAQQNRLTEHRGRVLKSCTIVVKDVLFVGDIAVKGTVINNIILMFFTLETDGICKRQVSMALNARNFAEQNRPAHALSLGR